MIRAIVSVLILMTCLWAGGASAGEAIVPVRGELGIFVVDITDLNERASTFQIELDIISRWHDPQRAFEPLPGESDARVLLDDAAEAELREGWWPALHATNEVGAGDHGLFRMIVKSDGTVINRVRLRMRLRAPLDFRDFPFDQQVLPIRVESYLRSSENLQLHSAEDFTGFDTAFELPEWDIVDLITEREQVLRSQEGVAYDRLSFLVSVERQTGYYIWKIMLPMLIIVALSWVVFWMSGEQLGRRAGISSTGMLTIIAYQFIVAGSLPRFPYLTVMDRFVLVSLLAVAATMLQNLVGSRLTDKKRLKLDRVCRAAFPLAYSIAITLVLAA